MHAVFDGRRDGFKAKIWGRTHHTLVCALAERSIVFTGPQYASIILYYTAPGNAFDNACGLLRHALVRSIAAAFFNASVFHSHCWAIKSDLGFMAASGILHQDHAVLEPTSDWHSDNTTGCIVIKWSH